MDEAQMMLARRIKWTWCTGRQLLVLLEDVQRARSLVVSRARANTRRVSLRRR
jgi:hypothetical protein